MGHGRTGEGTVAVVTGAGRGFGREIARRLVARGHRVVITDLDEGAVTATAAEIGATAVAADARVADDHRRVAAAARALGPVRVWVNNAGVLRAGKVWEHADDDVELMIDANLLGVVHGSRAAVEVMRGSTAEGHLLNIASMSAHGPVPGLAVYAATKAAVLNFSLSLQGDLDLDGVPIRVHALCPDAADTAMVRAEQVFGLTRFTIISQRFHDYRAVFIARHEGLDVVAYNSPREDARQSLRTEAREFAARAKAVVDLFVIFKRPRFLGE
ncbi:MAG: SDR family NAD(P)-dependent oxidoreductase, partial [Pseudonocardia sp.]|nr:SDR family NAD(P)-dependent oxidoreductase [Pseudonocardia sp.]